MAMGKGQWCCCESGTTRNPKTRQSRCCLCQFDPARRSLPALRHWDVMSRRGTRWRVEPWRPTQRHNSHCILYVFYSHASLLGSSRCVSTLVHFKAMVHCSFHVESQGSVGWMADYFGWMLVGGVRAGLGTVDETVDGTPRSWTLMAPTRSCVPGRHGTLPIYEAHITSTLM